MKNVKNRAGCFVTESVITSYSIHYTKLYDFGYAATYDLENVRYAVFDESRSALSRELIAGVEGSGKFRLTGYLEDERQVAEFIDQEKARLVIHIGSDFRNNFV